MDLIHTNGGMRRIKNVQFQAGSAFVLVRDEQGKNTGISLTPNQHMDLMRGQVIDLGKAGGILWKV